VWAVRRLVGLAGPVADRTALVAEVVRQPDLGFGSVSCADLRWAVVETLNTSIWPQFPAPRAWLAVLPVLARHEPAAAPAGCDQVLAMIARES
jgi:hypothetical protein